MAAGVASKTEFRGQERIMIRGIVAACCILGASHALEAGEVCIVCEGPVATYRCTFEQSARDHQIDLGDAAQTHVCESVLKNAGGHKSCKNIQGPEPCNGSPRTVTVADYQRLVASDGHSTYEPGMLDKAQRSVNSTWGCLTSFFGNC
jgi:hypothetical protein